jgi:large conductance mechanosensitive channel
VILFFEVMSLIWQSLWLLEVFGKIVDALVKDVITPFIGAFGGQPNFSGISFAINKSKFLIGDFLNALISFLIIAAVIYYFVVVPMNHLIERIKRKEKVDLSEKTCLECLSLIPVKAKRCKFCTASVK